MNLNRLMIAAVGLTLSMCSLSFAVSSSLYVTQPATGPAPITNSRGKVSPLSPSIAQSSFTAVPIPKPQKFEINDLVTIIILESQQTSMNATLNTEKKNDLAAGVTDFPNLDLNNLLHGRLSASTMSQGPVKAGVNYDDKFRSNGNYQRQSTMTGRITARVIDVKPNGTLVLEARKKLKSDNEALQMVLTGTCRAQDVTADNTILSTQLYDLNLTKNHTGALRNASEKGILSKLLDLIFNF